MDDFFEMVYRVVSQVPRGRVTSYGAIARYLGTGRSARMVGWAMNKALTYPGDVPAHRVVNARGLLTGKHHFETESQMQELLGQEGILVEDNQVKDFDKLFWDPARELEVWLDPDDE